MCRESSSKWPKNGTEQEERQEVLQVRRSKGKPVEPQNKDETEMKATEKH